MYWRPWRRPALSLGFSAALLAIGGLFEAFRGLVLRSADSPILGSQSPELTGNDATIAGVKWLVGGVCMAAVAVFLFRMDARSED